MLEKPSLETLYRHHLEKLDSFLVDALARAALAGNHYSGVVFHAGRDQTYHADDETIVFRPTYHCKRYVPALEGPEHVVLARLGQKPKVFRVFPRDFWHESTAPAPSHYENAVDLVDVGSFAEIKPILGSVAGLAFVGGCREAAAELGIAAIEPASLLQGLDWHRASKTDYEIALTRVACGAAAAGHAAARDAFFANASEREIHWAYLQATGALEKELPFSTIMALGEKAATLHYQKKRGREVGPQTVFLADAGAAHLGYAADITRTWTTADAHPVFRALVAGLDRYQRDLVAMVVPGRPYAEIHLAAHRALAELLIELDIVRMSVEDALESRATRAFFPHGVGHLLGLQVHEVGGKQRDPDGGLLVPPDEHVLRNTRTLEVGHLVTIEPGCYFIPMLLEPWRQGARAAAFNWSLIDQLLPCGGVRIEDDIVCTANGPDDLTRALIEVS